MRFDEVQQSINKRSTANQQRTGLTGHHASHAGLGAVRLTNGYVCQVHSRICVRGSGGRTAADSRRGRDAAQIVDFMGQTLVHTAASLSASAVFAGGVCSGVVGSFLQPQSQSVLWWPQSDPKPQQEGWGSEAPFRWAQQDRTTAGPLAESVDDALAGEVDDVVDEVDDAVDKVDDAAMVSGVCPQPQAASVGAAHCPATVRIVRAVMNSCRRRSGISNPAA